MRAALSTGVPFSSQATKRIWGKAVAPRLAPGRPKASAASLETDDTPLPVQAPLVSDWAIGATTASYSLWSGSAPKPLRACEMPDSPVPAPRCRRSALERPTPPPSRPPVRAPTDDWPCSHGCLGRRRYRLAEERQTLRRRRAAILRTNRQTGQLPGGRQPVSQHQRSQPSGRLRTLPARNL